MATFRTSYEQQKWDRLTSEAQQALDNLSKGVTTMEDLKRASALIAKYQSLASTVFATGIKAIEDSAKAQVQAIQEQMEKEGKSLTEERLTELLDEAVEEGWAENGVELTALLEEMIKAGFEDQEKSVSKIDQLLNQYLPELVTRDYMATLNVGKEPEKEPSAIKRTLVKSALKEAINEAANDDNGGQQQRSAVASTLSNYATKAANDSNIVALAPDVQEDLKEVLEDQHRIKEDITEAVTRNTKTDPKEEEKKANVWLRAWNTSSKTASTVGRSIRSKRGALLGAITGLLALGGRALLAELTGGKVSSVIDKYLDPDQLKIAFTDFWQDVKRHGRSIVDYIVKGASWLAEKAGFIDTNENLIGKYESALNDARTRASYYGDEQKRWKDLAQKTTNPNTRDAYIRRSEDYGKKRDQAVRDTAKFESDKQEAQRRVDAGIQEVAPPLPRDTTGEATFPQAPTLPTSSDTVEPVEPTITDAPEQEEVGGIRGLLRRWFGKEPSNEDLTVATTTDHQGPSEDITRPYFGGPRRAQATSRRAVSTQAEEDDVSFSGGLVMEREASSAAEAQAQRSPEAAGGGPIASIAGIGYSSSVDGVLGIVNAGILAS